MFTYCCQIMSLITWEYLIILMIRVHHDEELYSHVVFYTKEYTRGGESSHPD